MVVAQRMNQETRLPLSYMHVHDIVDKLSYRSAAGGINWHTLIDIHVLVAMGAGGGRWGAQPGGA